MKIWLDDIRQAPLGYTHTKSGNETKEVIIKAEQEGVAIELLDLDHDLGDFAYDGGDAIKILDWLIERGTLYQIEIHTANPVGRDNMLRTISRYWN